MIEPRSVRADQDLFYVSPSIRVAQAGGTAGAQGIDGRAPRDGVSVQALPPLGATANDRVTGDSVSTAPIPTDGLSLAELSGLIRQISIPQKSPTLQGVLINLFTGARFQPDNFSADGVALRLAVLYRAGQLEEIQGLLGGSEELGGQPVLQSFYALSLLGSGRLEEACKVAQGMSLTNASLQDQLAGQVQLLNAYCAAVDERYDPANAAIDLARKHGVDVTIAGAVVEAVRNEKALDISVPERLTLQDYAFLRLGDWDGFGDLVGKAEPAALFAMTNDGDLDVVVRLGAVEQAVAQNVMGLERLASLYLSAKEQSTQRSGEGTAVESSERILQRAQLYQRLVAEKAADKKLKLAASLLQSSREDRLFREIAMLVADEISGIEARADLVKFAGSAIDAFGASYDPGLMGRWIDVGVARQGEGGSQVAAGRGFDDWLVLTDLLQRGQRGERGAQALVRKVDQGGISPRVLHRYVSVLDALGEDVSLPLWDIVGRSPQPNDGYLPQTGVLSQLQRAARSVQEGRDQAKAVLLVMASLGPDGPAGAHVIALADSIRALDRAGLKAEARLLGFEALYAIWPRNLGQ